MGIRIVVDHTGELADRLLEARDAALKAAGYVYANAVKRDLAGGYTSGDFVTGHVLNSVTVGEPGPTDAGGYGIAVGTDVPYALFWEMGHFNLFTRKYERVEIWRPALDATEPEIIETVRRTFQDWLLHGSEDGAS